MSARLTPASAAFRLRAIVARLPERDPRREEVNLRLACIRRRDAAKALEDVSIIAKQFAEEPPGNVAELRRDVDARARPLATAGR